MPQVHTYLPKALVAKIRQRAEARGLSLSRYLAEIVAKEVGDDWPEAFFHEVVGGWQGDPLTRPEQHPIEDRDEF